MVNSKSGYFIGRKLFCLFFVFVVAIVPAVPFANAAEVPQEGTAYPYIFVAGYAGWGDYESFNKVLPYWGRLNGDLLTYLGEQGYECHAATTNPLGSAWDRACELYAQLTGTVVDYGEVHSKTHHHLRYGYDFSQKPLIDGWGEKDAKDNLNKLNFIAHSFGGATVRLMAELLANGCKEEVEGTSGEVSGLFTGGKADWIYSISTYASPHNGTTSMLLHSPYDLLASLNLTKNLVAYLTNPTIEKFVDILRPFTLAGVGDQGIYDLTIDGAEKLNEHITTIENIYYFSTPTDATVPSAFSDNRIPDLSNTDPFSWFPTFLMGRTGTLTPNGTLVGKEWFANDGIVNTFSSAAPKNEPQKRFDAENIRPGVWHIMDTFRGDHAAIIGGLTYAVDINELYLNQIKLINAL